MTKHIFFRTVENNLQFCIGINLLQEKSFFVIFVRVFLSIILNITHITGINHPFLMRIPIIHGEILFNDPN